MGASAGRRKLLERTFHVLHFLLEIIAARSPLG